MSYKLHNQTVNQDFFGVLRGDLNFDYVSAPVSD